MHFQDFRPKLRLLIRHKYQLYSKLVPVTCYITEKPVLRIHVKSSQVSAIVTNLVEKQVSFLILIGLSILFPFTSLSFLTNFWY